MNWLRALKETARSGLAVERTSLAPLAALRGAVGVALVIGAALRWGSPELAVSSAFGAFASGVATFQRSWRPRPVLALAAATGLAVSTFLGYLLVDVPPAFVVLLAVWAFGAGMSWGAGPTAGVVAGLTVAVMLITVMLPDSLPGALAHVTLIALGGVVQALLIVLFPIRPWGERRDVLADALAAVADYARRLRHDPVAPFDPEPLIEARMAAAISPRQARRRPRQLHGYRALAERFRPVLASLADPVVGGTPTEGPERERVRELLAAAATVLDAAARAIRRGERVRIPEEALEVLRVPQQGPVLNGPAQRAAFRLIALTDDAVEAAQEPVEVTSRRPLRPATWHAAPETGAGALERAAPREPRPFPTADANSQGGGGRSGGGRVRRPRGARALSQAAGVGGAAHPRHLHRPSLAALAPVAVRAFQRELRWSSPILRHALRVSGVAAAGYLVSLVFTTEHGYWIPLTAVMVLRPDFSRTFERGVGRFTGTLLGVAVAGAVVGLTHPGPYLSAAFAVLAVALQYLLTGTGYALISVCTGAYVIFLLSIPGAHWSQTVYERVLLTAIGGALALLSYALFPAWETPRLRDRLADWLTANGRYAVAVLDCFARPADRAPRQVREALLDARSARQEWEQTVERAGAEPVRHRGKLSRRKATDAQSAMVTMGRAVMLLEAHIPDRDAEPSPPAGEFTAALAPVLTAAAEAVRTGTPVETAPVHAALADWTARAPLPPPVALRTADLLVEALDELATAVRPPASRSTDGA
ncbi:FUSC family protein [Streptomyces sp. AJS327]|nr:FUSC family protein [Streptomyces sp. AJS327]